MAETRKRTMKWNEVKDGILPKESGYVIAVYSVDDYRDGHIRVVHEVFYDAEQKKFFGIFRTELDVIAWMYFPKYNEKQDVKLLI